MEFAITKAMFGTRELYRLNDAVVFGEQEAQDKRAKLLPLLAADLRKEPIESWKASDNLFALLSYTLSGGDPSVLRGILIRRGIHEKHIGLATWVLAFTERRADGMRPEPRQFEISFYPNEFGSALLLARASTLASGNPAGALVDLELVQLLAPGAQREESALRLQASVLVAMGNLPGALRTALRYLRRFPHSLYARLFIVRLASELAASPAGNSPELVEILRKGVGTISEDSARLMLQALGRIAIAYGRLKLAFASGSALVELSEPASQYHDQGRMIRLVAMAPLGPAEEAHAGLKLLVKPNYSIEDQELIAAATDIASQISARRTGAGSKAAMRDAPRTGVPAANKNEPPSTEDAKLPMEPAPTAQPGPMHPMALQSRLQAALKAADVAIRKNGDR